MLIIISFNFEEVNQKGKLGQLIVDIPMADANAINTVKETFNVIYHLIEGTPATYLVDNDGTTVAVSANGNNVRLVYNTPFYKTK